MTERDRLGLSTKIPGTAPLPGEKFGTILRYACLVTAANNMGGSLLLALFYPQLFAWLGVPMPADLFSFYSVLGFSFGVGVLALAVFLNPARAAGLLVVGIVSKAVYALITFSFYAVGELHWFWLIPGAWDALFVVVFWLYLIRVIRPELMVLNAGELAAGVDRPRTRQALILYYTLTGNSEIAAGAVRTGLEAEGYECDCVAVEPADQALFSFPFTWRRFLRIAVGALIRCPARIKPLDIPENRDYDLIVCLTQTWMLGVSAPIEGVFLDPTNRHLFDGRDVAIVNVCRGLWRRSQGQLAAWVDRVGGRLVGTSPHENPGGEPFRTLSLFIFLAVGSEGKPAWLRRILTPQSLDRADEVPRLEAFGRKLASRPRDQANAASVEAA